MKKKMMKERFHMSHEKYFIIVVGLIIIVSAIYHYTSQKPLTIYHNIRPILAKNITNVAKHNHATALLLFIYGLIFILEGVIFDQTVVLHIAIFTAVPGMFVVMAIYEFFIRRKYSKR